MENASSCSSRHISASASSSNEHVTATMQGPPLPGHGMVMSRVTESCTGLIRCPVQINGRGALEAERDAVYRVPQAASALILTAAC